MPDTAHAKYSAAFSELTEATMAFFDAYQVMVRAKAASIAVAFPDYTPTKVAILAKLDCAVLLSELSAKSQVAWHAAWGSEIREALEALDAQDAAAE